MKIVVAPAGELTEITDVNRELRDLTSIAERVASEVGIRTRTYQLNLGLGADWVVSTIEVVAWTAIAAASVPELHKRVRESVEECKRMHNELSTLIRRLAGGRRIVRQPIEARYLVALDHVLSTSNSQEVRLILSDELPIDPDFSNGFIDKQHHLFAFQVDRTLRLVAVDGLCKILWEKSLEPPPVSKA